jgi:hypothetical protein
MAILFVIVLMFIFIMTAVAGYGWGFQRGLKLGRTENPAHLNVVVTPVHLQLGEVEVTVHGPTTMPVEVAHRLGLVDVKVPEL